jgi:hypothetical protein
MPDQATQTDPQEGKWGVQPGKFLRLASAMYKDEDLTITRRFGDLHMLRILGLQSELDELRNKFLALCAEAREPDYEAMPYNYLAVDPLREEVHLAAKQHRKRQEEEKRELNAIIGSKLKEYSKKFLAAS